MTKVGWYFCGEGHIFSYGDEDWHAEAGQGYEIGVPVPRYCTFEKANGDTCMDSSHLIGPFSMEKAQERRDEWIETNRTAPTKILPDRPVLSHYPDLDSLPAGTIIRAVGVRTYRWTDKETAPVGVKGEYDYWSLIGAGCSYESSEFLVSHISYLWQVID